MNSLITLKNVVSKKQVLVTKEEFCVDHLISYNRCNDNIRVTWITCNSKCDALCLRQYLCESEFSAYVSKASVCVENCEIMEIIYEVMKDYDFNEFSEAMAEALENFSDELLNW